MICDVYFSTPEIFILARLYHGICGVLWQRGGINLAGHCRTLRKTQRHDTQNITDNIVRPLLFIYLFIFPFVVVVVSTDLFIINFSCCSNVRHVWQLDILLEISKRKDISGELHIYTHYCGNSGLLLLWYYYSSINCYCFTL